LAYVEAARVLAQRMMGRCDDTGTDRVRLQACHNAEAHGSRELCAARSFRYGLDKFQTDAGSAQKFVSNTAKPS
jgi:hypothetical protein